MQRLLLIGIRDWTEVRRTLEAAGYETRATTPDETALRDVFDAFLPDGLLVELQDDVLLLQHVRRILRADLNARPIPLLALARPAHLTPFQLVVGVDDFLLPPYDANELTARIQMLLWRYRRVDAQHCVRIGDMTIDTARRLVMIGTRRIALTPKEYLLLQFLATHRRNAFTREALQAQVWGYDFEGDVRVVDAYITRVRRKLCAPYAALLETVRGVGYRLREEQEEG